VTKRQKTFYPAAQTSTRRAPPPGSDQSSVRPNLASIDLTAGRGRPGLSVGDRVRIQAAGQFNGEIATIERLIGGPIPAAVVRTSTGSSRHARTIDLEPVRESHSPPTTVT
jgi:hypothetical protein